MKKYQYDIEKKDIVIYYNLERGCYPDVVGISVYVPALDDWHEIEADDLSINDLKSISNDVLEFVENNKPTKEWRPEHELI